MSRVYGLRCESCGKLDIGSAEEFLYEDQFPRSGWISVTLWIGDANAGPEHSVCSQKCLNSFSFPKEELEDDDEICCSEETVIVTGYPY